MNLFFKSLWNSHLFLRSRFPSGYSFFRPLILWAGGFEPRELRFTRIYYQKGFYGKHSASGPGSEIDDTVEMRKHLPRLIDEFGVGSMLDIPCGDYHWMKSVPLGIERYTGADIVAELINDNQRRYAKKGTQFILLDLVKDKLPPVDLIFCRDCFIHLSYREIFSAIQRFKESGSKHLMLSTYPSLRKNIDLVGLFRFINMELHPFNFSPPLRLIDEACTQKTGKAMGLWEIAELP